MADAAAVAAVGFLLGNLQQVVQYRSNLIKGATGEINKLEEDLRLFQAFLKKSAKQRLEDDTSRVLVGRIRNVVNDTEDIIDMYVTKVAATNSRNYFFRAFNKPLYLHGIATRVQLIVQDIKRICGDRILDLATHNNIGNDGPTKRREGPREVKRENIVGFADESDKIIGYLMEKPNYLDVISIIGMPGLGKTTLASKVFHHETIPSEFPIRIWLYISQEFTENNVFLAILKELMDLTVEENKNKYREMQESDLQVLVQEIKTRLKDKKFLIVMDDVWTPEDWGKIQKALPMTNHAGKVLITSRHEEVSNAVNQHKPSADKLHVLRPKLLNEEESWLLLQYEVFNKPECPIELEGYGKEIARKCHGLPLAIAVIGGLLVNKFSASGEMTRQKDAWEKVSRSVRTHLFDVDPQKSMEKIIAWSYDDLPYHLRACFLYLGMFPEDFEIPVWKLIRTWIAEGFIEQKNDLSLEEVAEIYLDELFSRNLVKADKTRFDGRVKTCRIHDMVREFCIKEAGSVNENFFHDVKRIPEGQKCRRICTDSIITSFSIKSLGPHVRSFVCFSKERVTLPEETTSAIPTALQLLRVLVADSIKFKRIPKEMYQLLHLRYLTLCGVKISVIPTSLSKLWNLETFIVHTEEGIVQMKVDIWKLRQLRHLKTNRETTFPKAKKSGGIEGKKLQTLGRISPNSCTEEIFNRACNLKELIIVGELNDMNFNNLVKLGGLEKLKLFGVMYGGISELPVHPFPPQLKSLTLWFTYLDWDGDMHILGLLENLEVLKLKEYAFTKGTRWEAKDGAFRRLEFLHIDCFGNGLELWEASGHHYPRLRYLRLHNAKRSYLEVPMGLADNPNFRVMELSGRYSWAALKAAQTIEKAKKEKLGEQNVKDGAFKILVTGTGR